MRTFSSYGPIDTDLHYYVPRTHLIERALSQLVGESPNKGGHYITVWAPRQCGKTWLMAQVLRRLWNDQQYEGFDVVALSLQHFMMQPRTEPIAQFIARNIVEELGLDEVSVNDLDGFYSVFEKKILNKPLILVLDEFDALPEVAINGIAGVFRNIYNHRQLQAANSAITQPQYLLHGVALIGVHSVLGIEHITGSPFNVQHSLHIPNLTAAEVEEMFHWYEQESGQRIEAAVIERVFHETQGQPGLTSWLGELLTANYNQHHAAITMEDFEYAYAAALEALPNANILNMISKAKQEPYRELILDMFQTNEKIPFRLNEPHTSFLYTHGVIDWEIDENNQRHLKFASPFVQKGLFNYFSFTHFRYVGKLYEPFEELSDTITESDLNVKNLIRRFERHLRINRDWLLKDAPRRSDLRIYEAIYHFALYMFVANFLQRRKGQVFPEFPTGNGKIDLVIKYARQVYGLELKTFADDFGYREALMQAAGYGRQLGLCEVVLVCFIETIDEKNREKYESVFVDIDTDITVVPIFVETLT
ncbi:MAG: hypothetical protein ETSY2_14050 [Candidatus Entotheonella gemina]|uniref:AAA+ ATPase domain-containing protein n=1 Tax=Candidatus Entotheonella gemina TaxID=1429439 RepID=W4M9S7_9BACT|nr:MAG: hypothetical protein ETSY2_14050 [Candidatus Entotheonella gemina]